MSGVNAVKTYLNMYTSDLQKYVGRGKGGTYIFENSLEDGGKVYTTVAKELGPNNEPRIIKRVVSRPLYGSDTHITVTRDTDLNQKIDIVRAKRDEDIFTTIKTKNYARGYENEEDLPPEKKLDILSMDGDKGFGLKLGEGTMKPVSRETLKGNVKTHILDSYI